MLKETIVYVGGFELPDKNAAAHRVLGNGKILKKLGYNVVFIGIKKSLNFKRAISNTRLKVQGFDSWYISYPNSGKDWFKYFFNIKPVTQVINEYSDVKAVICYNYQSIPFMKLMRFCKTRHLKIIADCTEWYGPQGKNILMKAVKGMDSFLRMRIIHKKVDGLIVISRFLQRYYIKHDNLILIPPLVDLSEEKWKVHKNYRGDNHRIKLVYAGSPGKKKDRINKIIRTLYLLRDEFDFQLIIVGLNKDKYLLNHPEDTMILRRLSSKIRFLGIIPHGDSLTHIRESDFSIFIREDNISNKAGFPTKLVESISCGTPVITNNTSNISDYIQIGYNGFIVCDCFEDDLRDIFLKSETDLRKMKKNIVKNTFDYHNYVSTFDKFIKGLGIKVS